MTAVPVVRHRFCSGREGRRRAADACQVTTSKAARRPVPQTALPPVVSAPVQAQAQAQAQARAQAHLQAQAQEQQEPHPLDPPP